MGYLVLVRHGESRWNLDNKFTGWVDVPLSEKGIYEALVTAEQLEGFGIDIAFTSTLTRAQETLLLVLAKQDYTGIFMHKDKRHRARMLHPRVLESHETPIHTSSALNERFYGKLQGMNKNKARQKFGEKQVFVWRRSYGVRPPGGECLKDTYARAVPYFVKYIMPEVRKGKNVIVSAHGNSLRAIVKYLDEIEDERIPNLELPTGKPIIYHYARGRLKQEQEHQFTRPVHWHPRTGEDS